MKNKENEYVRQIYISQPPIIHQPFIVVPPSPMGNYIVHAPFSPHEADYLKITYYNDYKQTEPPKQLENYSSKKIIGVKKSQYQNPYSHKSSVDQCDVDLNYSTSQASTNRSNNIGQIAGQCGIVRNQRTQSLFSTKLAEQAKSPPAASGSKNVFAKDTEIQNIVETLKQNIIRDLQEVSKKIMGFNTNDETRFSFSQDGSKQKSQNPSLNQNLNLNSNFPNNQNFSQKSHTPSFRNQLNKMGQGAPKSSSPFEFEESPVCQKPQRQVKQQMPLKFKECFDELQKEIEEQIEPEEEQISNIQKELTLSSINQKGVNISFESFQDEPIKLYNTNNFIKNDEKPSKQGVNISSNQSIISSIKDKANQSIQSSQKDKSITNATNQSILSSLTKQREFNIKLNYISNTFKKELSVPLSEKLINVEQTDCSIQEESFGFLSDPVKNQNENDSNSEFSLPNDFNQNDMNIQDPISTIRENVMENSVQQQRMTFGAVESDEDKRNPSIKKCQSNRGQLTKKDRYQLMMQNFRSLRSQSGGPSSAVKLDFTTEVEQQPDLNHISDFIIYSNFMRESQSLQNAELVKQNSHDEEKKLVTFQENNFVHQTISSEQTEESIRVPTFNEAQEYNEFFYVSKRYFSGKNNVLPPLKKSDKKNRIDRQSSFKEFLKSQQSIQEQGEVCRKINFSNNLTERKNENSNIDQSIDQKQTSISGSKSPQQKPLSIAQLKFQYIFLGFLEYKKQVMNEGQI